MDALTRQRELLAAPSNPVPKAGRLQGDTAVPTCPGVQGMQGTLSLVYEPRPKRVKGSDSPPSPSPNMPTVLGH